MYCCPFSLPSPKRAKIGPTPKPKVIMRFDDTEDETELEPSCGFVTNLKIFGGIDAAPHEFPWAVALGYVNVINASKLYLCGATLISSRFVLTAAHCINSRGDYHLARVRLGHADLQDNETSIEMDIESVFLHPNFETEPILRNDLALLKLTNPVSFNSFVRPICLGKSDQGCLDTANDLILDQ
jgi:hypothetical protein